VVSGDRTYVSNTLPGLLQVSGLSLRTDYPRYSEDMATVKNFGIRSYSKTIPSNGPPLGIVYYNNLRWEKGNLTEIEKPDLMPDIIDFRGYREFLKGTARKLGENAMDGRRSWMVDMMVGLSSGYDSVATAVVAKHAGCVKSASIVNSTSLWRGKDSGYHLAKQLGVDVERSKMIILGLGTLVAAITIPFCGMIGFVGLMIPHIVRRMIGPDHRFLVPGSAIFGASFLILSDLFSRSVLNITIPLGIVTGLIGGAFFIYLLRARRFSS
jgi:hypothetical protein